MVPIKVNTQMGPRSCAVAAFHTTDKSEGWLWEILEESDEAGWAAGHELAGFPCFFLPPTPTRHRYVKGMLRHVSAT